jgi:hypothetical protein
MNPISSTKLRRPLFLALVAAASLGLTGCAVKDGKWAPFSYGAEGCGGDVECDRDHGSDSSGSSSSDSSSSGSSAGF